MIELGFPGGSAGKESARNARDLGSIPGLGTSPGEGSSNPLQYSGLEKSMGYPWGHKESDKTEQLSLSLLIELEQRAWIVFTQAPCLWKRWKRYSVHFSVLRRNKICSVTFFSACVFDFKGN